MKFKLLFIINILLFYFITLCYSNKYHITTKCCSKVGQILNPALNGCIDNTQISLKSNISDLKNISNLNYTTPILPDLININTLNNIRINLQCEFPNIEVLFANEFNISQSNILTPITIKGVSEFNSNEFCWDKVKDNDEFEGIIALTCPCLRGPCVHVCCKLGEMLEMEANYVVQCINSTEKFSNWTLEGYLAPNNEDEPKYFTVYGKPPHCENDESPVQYYDDRLEKETVRHTVLRNGILNIYHGNDSHVTSTTDASKYCIVPYTLQNSILSTVEILLCEKSQSNQEKLHSYIYGPLFILGALFLLATIVVHIMLPELRNTVRGLSLMAHCACMFVAHVVLTIIQIYTSGLYEKVCTSLAFISQFALLTGFFWMNVMCIDLSLAFRSIQRMAIENRILRMDEIKKFYYFTIYAIGIPFLLLLITIWANENERVPHVIRPHIGNNTCWFGQDDKYAIVMFFYGPLGLILLFNLALFIFTVIKIYSFSRQDSILTTHNTSQIHNTNSTEHKSFILFIKLFGLMGIPWFMEIISWAVEGEEHFWYLTDAINLLRSVFIFIMFCCKSEVWTMLKNKYPCIKTWTLMAPSSTPQQHQLQNLNHDE